MAGRYWVMAESKGTGRSKGWEIDVVGGRVGSKRGKRFFSKTTEDEAKPSWHRKGLVWMCLCAKWCLGVLTKSMITLEMANGFGGSDEFLAAIFKVL